jgi:excisionase family DNA binding protein
MRPGQPECLTRTRDKRDIHGVNDAVGPGEAARRLGVSTRTVQRWLREGRLPAVRVGSRLKVAAVALPPTSSAAADTKQVAKREIARLLIANRGELVVRIARTCRRLGITSLALVADDQQGAWWTSSADEIVPLSTDYLDIDAVIDAARAAGADAIHPGYGFLAENADFANAVANAGLTWVGPPPAAMRALGDKAAARRLAAAHGVPILPGYDGDDQSDRRLTREARQIGLPLLIKPSAGGGGKGMHVVDDIDRLAELLTQARREARTAFADDRLVLERFVARPRHVEIQLLCDGYGNAVHLGERECSLQRRHQKVVEEAPSPAVDTDLRGRMGRAAVDLARAAGYVGAGTAEFLLGDDDSFYFLELNARLQVEHPVTELVTGRDLVADQLAVAAGRPLDIVQADVRLVGHAIEARLYAEDAHAGFLPATGDILAVNWPARAGVRIDAGVGPSDVVSPRYDPLLAKIIGHAGDRRQALALLDEALDQTSVVGVTTNRGFLRWLLALPEVAGGRLHTTLIDEVWQPTDELPEAAWQQAASLLVARRSFVGGVTPGFRLNAPPRVRVELDGQVREIELSTSLAPAAVAWQATADDAIVFDFDGRSMSTRLARAPTVEAAVRHSGHQQESLTLVSATMPGSVLALRVAEGDEVEAGQVLLVLEAMKMENAVSAPAPAQVRRVLVSAGQQVRRGEPLVELA